MVKEISRLQSSCEINETAVRKRGGWWGYTLSILVSKYLLRQEQQVRIKWEVQGLPCKRKIAPTKCPCLSHNLTALFKKKIELPRQRDTKAKKTARAEMASAVQSPMGPLRMREDCDLISVPSPPDGAITCENPQSSCCRSRRAVAGGVEG